MDDVSTAVTMDMKASDSLVYIVGKTHRELGGSKYYKALKHIGNEVPKVDAKAGKILMKRLAKAIQAGLAKSCHDCSEGGMAVALAEMAFSGGFGLNISLNNVPVAQDVNQDY